MNIKLSDHFTYKKLLRFTLPSIVMMIFSSVYGVVDGFFVSNFAGKTPFAAVNFIMPLLMILGCVGFMFGTGGSALVAKTMGEGDREKANRQFSLIVYASIVTAVIIAVLGIIFLRPIASFMGAEGQMLDDCVTYGRIILIALPAFVLQMEFQSFFIAAEKPTLGLIVTVAAGVTNMVLDFLLVGVFPLGLVGAATATGTSQAVGGIIPLVYFACPNSGLLRLSRTSFDGHALIKTCINGSSELMSNISMSTVSILYNAKLLELEGENGVAAYGVLMYVGFIFFAAFIGYTIGIAPIVSYNYGASNHTEMKGLFKRSMVIIGIFSVSVFILSESLARPLSLFFVGYDAELLALSCRAFAIYSFSFLFAGYAIFCSGFFTALNDGLTSAIISFLRTLVFQIIAVLLLSYFMGTNGIWLSLVVAEVMAMAVGATFIFIHRKKYKYL